MKDISAVICTHNGSKTLSRAIDSLIRQHLHADSFEILIIDNGSTDPTRDIAYGFDTVKNLRYIFEPELGLSVARNTGWKNAEGEYVAYLDDDAIACSDWLEKILAAFHSVPHAGAVGGRVEPVWETDPPQWIDNITGRFLSLLDWSEAPMVLDDSKYLVGTNIAFPRTLLERFSGFPTDLGRKGASLISNEEIELIEKIKKENHVVYYDPAISVKHLIDSSRLHPYWFRQRFFSQGVSDAILYRRKERPSAIRTIGASAGIMATILLKPHNLFFAAFPALFPRTLSRSYRSIIMLGMLYGLIRMKT